MMRDGKRGDRTCRHKSAKAGGGAKKELRLWNSLEDGVAGKEEGPGPWKERMRGRTEWRQTERTRDGVSPKKPRAGEDGETAVSWGVSGD